MPGPLAPNLCFCFRLPEQPIPCLEISLKMEHLSCTFWPACLSVPQRDDTAQKMIENKNSIWFDIGPHALVAHDRGLSGCLPPALRGC